MGSNWAALATLSQHLVSVIDTGKYGHLTLEQVGERIAMGGVLAWLAKTAGDDIDLSVFLETQTYGDFLLEYESEIQNIWTAYGDQVGRKWAIDNSGLCMLLTWTIEILKQRIRDAQKGLFEDGDF